VSGWCRCASTVGLQVVVLMQSQSDLLQIPVELYPSPHATHWAWPARALGRGAAKLIGEELPHSVVATSRRSRPTTLRVGSSGSSEAVRVPWTRRATRAMTQGIVRDHALRRRRDRCGVVVGIARELARYEVSVVVLERRVTSETARPKRTPRSWHTGL